MPERPRPSSDASGRPGRFIAGLAPGRDFDEDARVRLEAAGARVVRSLPALGLLRLEIADPEAFAAPAFVVFLEREREVGPGNALP